MEVYQKHRESYQARILSFKSDADINGRYLLSQLEINLSYFILSNLILYFIEEFRARGSN